LFLLSTVAPVAKVLDHVLAGPQREGKDGNRGGLVCTAQEYAGVAHVEVRHVMRLPKTVGDKFPKIVPHTAGARLVQAVARRLGVFGGAPEFTARGSKDLGPDLLRVLPHLERVRVPLEMHADHWNAIDVFYFGIDIDVIGVGAQ